jgi:uncharacterized protein Yka (UPF0111/DUF47 family)
MPAKIDILENLGETALLLPQLINQALTANDRVKYWLTLLQSARDHADHPTTDVPSLQREREAAGVDDASMDAVVSASTRDGNIVRVPQAATIHARVLDGLREMLEPLKIAAADDAIRTQAHERYRQRFDRLVSSSPSLDHDRIPVDYIDAITHGRRGQDDGLHVLVMDLHRELNELQRHVASETLDGANVYGIDDSDRALVAAFMAGLNATAPLKFDHPGLSATATRVGDRLVLQNDIGTTDNHVIVLHIDELAVTITYTDVHRARLQFFQTQLQPAGFEWTATASRDAAYELCVGRVTARDRTELQGHLTLVGAQLVFLIDWNRARKRLSRFVRKSDAIAILKWAADHRVGHRAFLQAGDVRLVYTAMERAARAQIRFGARLDEVLGRESARSFLQGVLTLTAEGLRDHRSPRLIQDQIHAELLTHFQTSEQSALALAAEQASMVTALAGLVRDALALSDTESDRAGAAGLAARAKAWESRADQIVRRARTVLKHGAGDNALMRLLTEADDVADGLEEAAFLSTLLADGRASDKGLQSLRELADPMVQGTQAYVRCVECARDAHHLGTPEDVDQFLVAVDTVIGFEHESDERERRARATLVEVAHDFRELYVLLAIAECFEDAADTLARCALMLRDYVLDTLNTR